jgi:hypothetical protein
MEEFGEERGWVVFTGDEAIRHNPAERTAWRRMGLTTFFLQPSWMRTPMEERAWRFVRWFPRLANRALTE